MGFSSKFSVFGIQFYLAAPISLPNCAQVKRNRRRISVYEFSQYRSEEMY